MWDEKYNRDLQPQLDPNVDFTISCQTDCGDDHRCFNDNYGNVYSGRAYNGHDWVVHTFGRKGDDVNKCPGIKGGVRAASCTAPPGATLVKNIGDICAVGKATNNTDYFTQNPQCGVCSYSIEDIARDGPNATKDPSQLAENKMDDWAVLSRGREVGDSNATAKAIALEFFKTPIQSESCSIPPETYYKSHTAKAKFAQFCLPLALRSKKGSRAKEISDKYPTETDAILSAWCADNGEGVQDPRCACLRHDDPAKIWERTHNPDGSSAIPNFPDVCFYAPCMNSDVFYQKQVPRTHQCDQGLPSCMTIINVIDSNISDSVFNQYISCDHTDDPTPPGPEPGDGGIIKPSKNENLVQQAAGHYLEVFGLFATVGVGLVCLGFGLQD